MRIIGLFMLLAFIQTGLAAEDPLAREIRTKSPSIMTLSECLSLVVQNTAYSVLFVGANQTKIEISTPKSYTARALLDEICRKSKFHWELKNDVIVVRRQKEVSDLPVNKYDLLAHYSSYANNAKGIEAYIDGLWQYRLVRYVIEPKLNIPPENKKYTDFVELLCDLVRGTESLAIISEMSPKDSESLYKAAEQESSIDHRRIRDPHLSLWGMSIQHLPYLYQKNEAPYVGESVLNGNELLKCRLTLQSDNGKVFLVWLKNVSEQPLEFKNFRRENLVLNDVASDGEFFEVKEIRSYYLYPPEMSNIPENFILAPGEEKEFSFPVAGSRCRQGYGLKIFEDNTEETLSFKPENVEIMKNTNRKYNWYSVVVYFYRDGKKYKALNRDFVDSANFSAP